MWSRGDVVCLREIWDGRVWTARPWIVVEEQADLVVLWIPRGAPTKVPAENEIEPMARGDWTLVDGTWELPALRFHERGAAHSVLVFLRDGELDVFYVNMEEPWRPTPIGFDYLDQKLDLIVRPDGSWEWKDEDELDEAVARGIFSAELEREIRDEGERAVGHALAKRPPFDGSWEAWRPDPRWLPPALPDGWGAVS
jgi:Protein of unknown function (DUF402)